MSGDTRSSSARAFVRSLNILLKFARLYQIGDVRTMGQLKTTWKELRLALDESGDTGLLLGASGNQILLDGVPLGASASERSFAQLLYYVWYRQYSFCTQLESGTIRAFCACFS